MVKVNQIGQYLGEFRHNLTERNRLALPKRIRIEIVGNEVVLSRGFEECIACFDMQRWKKMADEQVATQFSEERARFLRRQIFSSALIVEIDGQGRVVIPDMLLSWAGLRGRLGEEVVIIGTGDYFELWQKERWDAYVNKLRQKDLSKS